MHILVLAATGNIGSQLVPQLRAAGHTVRAGTRNPAAADFPPDVQVVRVELSEPETLLACLDDIDAVFLLWALHTGAQLPKAVDLIAERARRIVFLGTGGIPDLSFDDQENLVHGCGIESVVLCPSTFAVNTLWWADEIRTGDIVHGSHGDLPMSLIHETDIAAVAARTLTENAHAGATYALTGPEVLTQAEQVRIIGEVLARPLRWAELTLDQARRRLLDDDTFPDSFVDALLDGYTEMLAAPRPEITSTVADITGRPARSLAEWVSDHLADFR
ncbi:NAD(P)H-binding protein [Nocardia vinacea]|uniref:SDR family oxidoreductase n=1 Tax=Nocardia vinacea TaxID=96468 RepID=UPI002E0F923C|nr:NAD(P)H-binding protein [Nocardia vinacea]